MKSLTLEVKPFGGKHSGQRISDEMQAILDEWKLAKDKLVLMLQDNAANGLAASRILGVPSLGCVTHGFHLVTSPLFFSKQKRHAMSQDGCIVSPDALDDYVDGLDVNDQNIGKVLCERIKRLRSLAKYFSKSPKGAERLGQFVRQCMLNELTLILDVVTRWNSSLDMLERLIKLKGAIAMWFVYVATEAGKNEFADFEKVQPSPSDWYHVECLILLLAPFKAATEVLSGEKYSTLALAFPILRLLKKKLRDGDVLDHINSRYTHAHPDIDFSVDVMFMGQVLFSSESIAALFAVS